MGLTYFIRRTTDRSLSLAVCETQARATIYRAAGWREVQHETYRRLRRISDLMTLEAMRPAPLWARVVGVL